MTIFIAVYLIALICYLFTRVSDRKLWRAVNKYIMATMYLVLAFVVFFRNYEFVSYQTLLMAALILAWLGDVFLVFDFGRGGDFFLAGNICFSLYEMIVLVANEHGWKDFIWAPCIAAAMLIAFIIACQLRPDVFKLGKMRWPMTFYLSSIFTHGLMGVALMVLLPGTNYAMMGLGSFLFMISDMILTAYNFVFGKNKWLIRANSITYFTGLLLIVLSTV